MEIDPAAQDINATAYDTSLTIDGSHVWVCYVDSALRVVLADGTLPSPVWRYTVVDSGNADDSHNLCGVGIDPSGHIHVAYNMHGGLLHYKRTTTAGNPATLQTATMGGTVATDVSYPRFHRAGSAFYFLARDGVAGSGDEYIKKLNAQGLWGDLAFPLIQGKSLSPSDNPYLGAIWPAANGDLHLVWTSRINSAGGALYNYGLYYARYDSGTQTWRRSDGTAYTLPIDRTSGEVIVSSTDSTLTNSGHAVAVSNGTIHVVYQRYPAGYREVFHALRTSSGWVETQISDLRAPRLRACPVGPQQGPEPRPCDMEVGGPVLVVNSSGALTVLYTRANGPSRGVWSRPAGVAYEARSLDDGESWQVRELHWPVTNLGSEFQRESGRLPYILVQEAGLLGQDTGRIALAEVPEPLPRPALRVAATNGSLEVPAVNVGASFSIVARILPKPTARRMGLVDKGGATGQRAYRLLLWGTNHDGLGFRYASDRVQVLVGNGAGAWGRLWYPQVTVPPGVVSHLVATSDGSSLKLYMNGALVAQDSYAASVDPPLSTASPTLVGGNYSAANVKENLFEGELDVEILPRALSAAEVAALFTGN